MLDLDNIYDSNSNSGSNYNFNDIESVSHSVKCSKVKSVDKIVSNLLNSSIIVGNGNGVGNNNKIKFPFYSSVSCDENIWSVVKCSSSDSSVILCVNCTNYCSLSSTDRSTSPSFIISCSSSVSSSIGKLFMLNLGFNQLSPPPNFISITTNPSSNSIEVSSELSGEGSLICAAYLKSTGYVPVSSDVLLTQGNPSLSTSTISTSSSSSSSSSISILGNYVISNLYASTSYVVYCTTLSPTSVTMKTNVMIESKVIVTTKCCRSLNINLNQEFSSSFNDKNDIPFALTLDIGNLPPRNQLIVSISAIQINSNLNSNSNSNSNSNDKNIITPFAPSIFSFTSSSIITTMKSTFLHSLSGSYRLNISLSGVSR